MMKKILLYKDFRPDNVSIYAVDGPYVRNNVCMDFAKYNHYVLAPYIPENEVWIEIIDNELFNPNFFVANAVEHLRCFKKTNDYKDAIHNGNIAEQKIRQRVNSPITPIKIKLLDMTIHTDIPIWLVDGETVRNTINVDFIHGGNDLAYKKYNFPKNEIWLENRLDKTDEIFFTLLHELHERNMMQKHDWVYLKSHKSANQLEKQARHDVKKIKPLIQTELNNWVNII